jgi:peptidylprolyl isomerase
MPGMRFRTYLATFVLLLGCESAPSAQSQGAPSATPSAATTTTVATGAANPTASAIPAPPDVAQPPADAVRSASGLASKVLKPGTGTDKPRQEDTVRVHYTGWTKDGGMFDSSMTRGQPVTFPLGRVIKGWTEGLQLMVVGEKRRLWIPAALAYGASPRPGAPAGDLVFDVELLEVVKAPDPPPVPEDVAKAPKSAKRTQSGLAYRVLKNGTGKKPSATDTVVVHYSGWTTDGTMFDSSVTRGRPATFRLDQVIKGWTEGVQLMKVGEKARFWIPGELAYGDKPTRPGAPAGMLVFDIELVNIGAPQPAH